MRRTLGLLVIALLVGACGDDNGPGKSGPTILFGVTATDQLVSFDATTPGTVTTTAITGLDVAEDVVALDFRPSNGALYLLTDASNIYTVNPGTGAASLVGAFTPPLDGSLYGFDINPAADRIRVVTNNEQNLRVEPATGSLANEDSDLFFGIGDPNDGVDPSIIGTAYSNNKKGAASTALFLIDDGVDALMTASNPNSGSMTTLGALGFNAVGDGGFDIARSGTAYAALVPTGSATPNLYTIDLSTGHAALVGAINSTRLLGLSAQP